MPTASECRQVVQDYFLQLIYLSEHINSQIAFQISARKNQEEAIPSVSFFTGAVFSVWRRINRGETIRDSGLIRILNHANSAASLDSEKCRDLCRFMLHPCVVREVPGKEGENWYFARDSLGGQSAPYLANVQQPTELKKLNFFRREILGCSSLSQREGLVDPVDDASREVTDRVKLNLLCWPETLDPVQVMRQFLIVSGYARNTHEASHFIQRAIISIFGLRHDSDSRKCIMSVCQSLNKFFYGSETLSTGEYRTASAGFNDIYSSVEVIRRSVASTYRNRRYEDGLRYALGIYFMMRFCRLLRYVYAWESVRNTSGIEMYQFASPVRDIKASYLLVRSFGSIGDIGGLNFVFQGGILPRIGTGRTLVIDGPSGAGKTIIALQKAAGLASRGGLAVYFSFEESYELIAARLLTFGFAAPDRYTVLDLEAECKGYHADMDRGEVVGSIIERHRRMMGKKGLLLLYSEGSGEASLPLMEAIRTTVHHGRKNAFRWIAVVIDSINAIELGQKFLISERNEIRRLTRIIEQEGVLGILISENAETECPPLVFLADTFIQVGHGTQHKSRWLEIKKCRSQECHPGSHSFRLVEGEGCRLYPSLSSVLSSLRFRNKSTLSEQRRIPFPTWIDLSSSGQKVKGMREKGSILIYGDANCRKTRLALEMALRVPEGEGAKIPTGVLVITFQTTEKRFEQELRSKTQSIEGGKTRLIDAWQRVGHRVVRWYSPGDEIAPEQIVAAIRDQLKRARNMGTPIDRVIVDELETVEKTLPKLRDRSLFWPTLIQLFGTEAITSFFVFGTRRSGFGVEIQSPTVRTDEIFESLYLECDYVLQVGRSGLLESSAESDLENVAGVKSSHEIKLVSGQVERYPDVIETGLDYP